MHGVVTRRHEFKAEEECVDLERQERQYKLDRISEKVDSLFQDNVNINNIMDEFLKFVEETMGSVGGKR